MIEIEEKYYDPVIVELSAGVGGEVLNFRVGESNVTSIVKQSENQWYVLKKEEGVHYSLEVASNSVCVLHRMVEIPNRIEQ